MAENELGTKFGTLVNSVDRYVEQISTLSALRPDGNIIPQQQSLMEIDDEVSELENRVAELKLFIHSEQAALGDLEQLLEPAFKHRQVINHFESNLPKHLPGTTTKKQTAQSESKADQSKEESSSSQSSDVYAALATQAEFDAVPSSTRLRCKLDEINGILTDIQALVEEKLEKRKPSSKKPKTISISEDELNSIPVLKKSLGGKTRALIHTLRALGRLRASLKDGKSVYIVVNQGQN